MDERLFSTHQDKRLHQPQFELHTRIVDRKEKSFLRKESALKMNLKKRKKIKYKYKNKKK